METEKTFVLKKTVEKKDLASNIGSGAQDVLASPVMICWMEEASVLCLDLQDKNLCSLGIKVDVDHIAPTPLGSEVTIRSRLVAEEGRRYTFEVEAFDAIERIGFGTHIRAVTNKERFMEKVNAKNI